MYNESKAEKIKIAYIGGGSRGWAWTLMSDLAGCGDMSGDVYLYDIDFEAAQHNEIIGNKFNTLAEAKSKWTYHAAKTAKEAYENADFVVISILPGTFDEMESDVHTPEKYGIYQSVGDTSGPGGIVRAMRTVPMIEEIGECVKSYCPDAWVINYTNPMTLCVKALYRVFPKIKAFGCCHEVFGTQELLKKALADICGIEGVSRKEIKVNPVAVNHFTWLTEAKYRNTDLFPIYREFAKKYYADGYTVGKTENWRNNSFACSHRVKFDLFLKYGYIAAAGDRHLAEFCEGKWYLESPEAVKDWGFGLTTVEWRKKDLANRVEKSRQLRSGERELKIRPSGEEGVSQMRALLGLQTLVTNVNIPNRGQIANLPLGAVVETNAVFRDDAVTPVMAGSIPMEIYPLVSRICSEQELLDKAIAARDVEAIFNIFANDPLVTCSMTEARALFREMVLNTKAYLGMYDLDNL
ncbi:MAG: alpha-glucosidase/alpha-galactosidase [Clostridia bacterium]|nr:alpha-glucosidase/alpha-galactosidase [Clostridia bacterium]